MFIIYKLPCLLYSHADFIMVITSVPPGTACAHLDCSIRVYSLMYKRICFGCVICMCVGVFVCLFACFYIIGRQKIKFLTKSGTSSTVDTDCLLCSGCSCDVSR